jgi:hypothetical protein
MTHFIARCRALVAGAAIGTLALCGAVAATAPAAAATSAHRPPVTAACTTLTATAPRSVSLNQSFSIAGIASPAAACNGKDVQWQEYTNNTWHTFAGHDRITNGAYAIGPVSLTHAGLRTFRTHIAPNGPNSPTFTINVH